MEMWWLGFNMDRLRLALFMLRMIPLLIILDRYSGFEETSTWLDDVADGFVAYGVGFVAATLVLFLLDVISISMPAREVIGKISLQAIPASFGAVLANSQMRAAMKSRTSRRRRRSGRQATGRSSFSCSWGHFP